VNPSGARSYTKPWISYRDQVSLLQSRGLIISDPEAAAETLSHIKYYRFSGYGLAFETTRHTFNPGTTFESIITAYEFDRQLRRLVLEATEWAEIDFRTAVSHEFARQYGPLGHTNENNFFGRFRHAEWLERVRSQSERSNEVFVDHFKEHYREFPDLPIWALVEIISFGDLSRLYSGQLREDQRRIAKRYRRQPSEIATWLHHLTYIRNLCAHYGRLWDRRYPIAPRRPHGKAWYPDRVPDNHHVYMTLLVLATILGSTTIRRHTLSRWKHDVEHLITTHLAQLPHPYQRMGLPTDWTQHPSWIALETQET
jgi:abortive infection bacteriophage resistance protein